MPYPYAMMMLNHAMRMMRCIMLSWSDEVRYGPKSKASQPRSKPTRTMATMAASAIAIGCATILSLRNFTSLLISNQQLRYDYHLVTTSTSVKPYNFESAILSAQAFRQDFYFFVYDAASDTFFVLHIDGPCRFGCKRLQQVAPTLVVALRKNFPGRFWGQQDLVIMISVEDLPRIKRKCLLAENNYCDSTLFAPILQFGSVFVNTTYLPSMIAMPMPVRPHLPCFNDWQLSDFGNMRGTCPELQPQEYGATNNPDYWENLIPQIIWRGSDFNFIPLLFTGMRRPEYILDIPQHELGPDGRQFANEYEKKRWAIDSLSAIGDEKLMPRWKGVLMTSDAELEASIENNQVVGGNNSTIPWVNIKFTNINDGGVKRNVGELEEYQKLQSLGISCIGESMSIEDQANYKYHIDIGGGGGTTWTGTIQKLALPGVLFHHVTPTKDWFHDLLVPWEHYIPINTDLSDLREKYEWAESHQDEARRISESGTSFVRWMASVEGFGQLYEAYLVAPLRNAINAYTHPSPLEHGDKRVLDLIFERGNDKYTVVYKCMRSQGCAP